MLAADMPGVAVDAVGEAPPRYFIIPGRKECQRMPLFGRTEGVLRGGAALAGTTGAVAAGGRATSSGRPSTAAASATRFSSGQDVLAPSPLAWLGVTTWAAASADIDRSRAVKAKRFMAFPEDGAAARFRTQTSREIPPAWASVTGSTMDCRTLGRLVISLRR